MIPKIYIASKMHHAPKWRAAYSRPDIHVVSRWPFLETQVDDCDTNCRKFWQDDFTDISSCDILILFAEEGENLRGALVEVGIAMGLGKQIIVIGDHSDHGTWWHHPLVRKVVDLEAAMKLAGRLTDG